MADRIGVMKTYKLWIGGGFPRSESGRVMEAAGVGGAVEYVARASRKDLRDAVSAARGAVGGWGGRTAYNRAQILYRAAEMLEGRSGELALALGGGADAEVEVGACVDRLVSMAGWCDKLGVVLGSQNPVAGPFHSFTFAEPVGVVGVIAPDEPGLLGMVSMMSGPLCAGNAVVALSGARRPVASAVFAEVLATSDVPAGVVNVLTGDREELAGEFASHRDIDALHMAGLGEALTRSVREASADSLKRVVVSDDRAVGSGVDWGLGFESPWAVEPFVEMKTLWHPRAV